MELDVNDLIQNLKDQRNQFADAAAQFMAAAQKAQRDLTVITEERDKLLEETNKKKAEKK